MQLTDQELALRWWNRLRDTSTDKSSKGYWVNKYLPMRMWQTLSQEDIFWIWREKAGEFN